MMNDIEFLDAAALAYAHQIHPRDAYDTDAPFFFAKRLLGHRDSYHEEVYRGMSKEPRPNVNDVEDDHPPIDWSDCQPDDDDKSTEAVAQKSEEEIRQDERRKVHHEYLRQMKTVLLDTQGEKKTELLGNLRVVVARVFLENTKDEANKQTWEIVYNWGVDDMPIPEESEADKPTCHA